MSKGGKTKATRKSHKNMKKRRTKTRKVKSVAKNTRNESCGKNGMTVCCPHLAPDEKGRYRATSKKPNDKHNTLVYRKRKYSLRTCCTWCADSMNQHAKSNPDDFDRKYKVKSLNEGELLILANKHTGKYIQILQRM